MQIWNQISVPFGHCFFSLFFITLAWISSKLNQIYWHRRRQKSLTCQRNIIFTMDDKTIHFHQRLGDIRLGKPSVAHSDKAESNVSMTQYECHPGITLNQLFTCWQNLLSLIAYIIVIIPTYSLNNSFLSVNIYQISSKRFPIHRCGFPIMWISQSLICTCWLKPSVNFSFHFSLPCCKLHLVYVFFKCKACNFIVQCCANLRIWSRFFRNGRCM